MLAGPVLAGPVLAGLVLAGLAAGRLRLGRPARPPARRAERVERDGAHVVPAHQIAAEDRPVHAGPHHPGHPVLADHREDAGHADPGPTGHGLLHQDLRRDVVAARNQGHLAEHPHRAAGVDHIGPALVNDLAEDVGDLAAHPHRAVLGGDRRGPPAAAGGERAEHPVGAGGTDQEVNRAATAAQPVRQREQRGAAVPAPDEQAAHRVAGNGKRPPERPGDVDHVSRPPPGQPAGTGADDGEYELHRAAVVGPHVVDRERAAQQHRGLPAAHRDRGELARPEPGRDPRRDHRHGVVRVHLAHGEHRPRDLDLGRPAALRG